MHSEQQGHTKEWKRRLYKSYVSSGQAGSVHLTPEKTFRPRKAYIQDIIQKHLPRDRNARILDVGCGHGAFLYFLNLAGFTNIHGVDSSPEQIETAKALGITCAECQSACDYLSKLPNAGLDAILLFDVLEHLEPQELFDMLDQVYRVLNPGGSCLIHVPNGEGIFGMKVRFGDLTHVQAFTQNSGRQLLTTIGFREVKCFEERPIPHGVKSTLRRLIWDAGTLPWRLLLAAETGSPQALLSANILIHAIKPGP